MKRLKGVIWSMITLNFLFTSLIIVLIPATGVIYTISTGLTLRRRASIFATRPEDRAALPVIERVAAAQFRATPYAYLADGERVQDCLPARTLVQ